MHISSSFSNKDLSYFGFYTSRKATFLLLSLLLFVHYGVCIMCLDDFFVTYLTIICIQWLACKCYVSCACVDCKNIDNIIIKFTLKGLFSFSKGYISNKNRHVYVAMKDLPTFQMSTK